MALALLDGVFLAMTFVGVGLSAVGLYSYQSWDEPGLRAFVAFCQVLGVAAVLAGVVGLVETNVLAGAPGGRTSPWLTTASIGLFVSASFWTLFALQYTGRVARLNRVVGTALFAPPAIGVPALLALLVSDMQLASLQLLNLVYNLSYVSIFGILFIGAYVLLRTTYVYGHLSVTQGVSLSLAVFFPWVSYQVGELFRQAPPSQGATIALLGVTGTLIGVSVALVRYDTFDATPAVGSIGQRAVSREIDDLVVVTDHRERVIELNEQVATTLGVDQRKPLGDPLVDLLGVDIETLEATDTVELHTADGHREFDAQVSALTDQHDRWLGHLVSLRDVTERRIRQQRLSVLNRVLRHNLRNKLSVVKGRARVANDTDRPPDEHLERIVSATDDLIGLSERAKAVADYMDDSGNNAADVDIPAVVERVLSDARQRYPEVEFSADVPDKFVVRLSEGLFEQVLANAVENAAQHNDADDPTVVVRLLHRDDAEHPICLDVVDNGPGLPEHELSVIQSGEETALEHGSGLGLWVLSWGTRQLGGTLSFDSTPGDGTTVHIELPHDPVSATAADEVVTDESSAAVNDD